MLRLRIAKIKNDIQNAIYSLEEAQGGGNWMPTPKREAYQENELAKAQKLINRAADAINEEMEIISL